MIAIVDYGLGNVNAFANVYNKLNIPSIIARKADDLKKASKVILPGVGAFDQAMQRLSDSAMVQRLNEIVLQLHVPVLGVCVGMQMLGCWSEEGSLPGLGWIDGKVERLGVSSFREAMCVPHMGWNTIKALRRSGLLQGIGLDARFYFLHSYYFNARRGEDIIAVTDYGGEFACVVNRGNVFGVQFHPEKSHQWGIRILENFARL